MEIVAQFPATKNSKLIPKRAYDSTKLRPYWKLFILYLKLLATAFIGNKQDINDQSNLEFIAHV